MEKNGDKIFFYFNFGTRNQVTRNRQQAHNHTIGGAPAIGFDGIRRVVPREPRIKSKRIWGIWYLENTERLRKPDGCKLSQRHFLKAVSILFYAIFYFFFKFNRFVTQCENVRAPTKFHRTFDAFCSS